MEDAISDITTDLVALSKFPHVSGDILSFQGVPVWSVSTTDVKGDTVIESISGIIHYHALSDGTWKTFAILDTTRYDGISKPGIDGMELTIAKVSTVKDITHA